MWRRIPTELLPHAVLLPSLQERGTRQAHARAWESELQTRTQLCGTIRWNAPAHYRAGRAQVPGLSGDHASGRGIARSGAARLADPSHQRNSLGQRTAEPHSALQTLPHETPSLQSVAVYVVSRVGSLDELVHDLQVERTSCYFAHSILVHNCLLIDGPTKNAKEARSKTIRDRIRHGLTWVAFTRLMGPVGRVIICVPHWHEDDLVRSAPRLQRRGSAQVDRH